MSIKSRLQRLENRYEPKTTSATELKKLQSLAYMLHDSKSWPDLQKQDDLFTNLKRIVPAPGEPIPKP